MSTLLLCNGRVIDPSQNIDQVADLWIEDGRIVGLDLQSGVTADRVLSCSGMIVAPGLIDMHVHLREPGREEDETIATGGAAALAGGVTSVACMPNTEPPLDTPETLAQVLRQAHRADRCNVFPIGTVSLERVGREIADLAALAAAGAVAFTDDGSPVYDAAIMRQALEICKELGKAVLVHAEVLELTGGGVMNEGVVSRELRLPGMPGVAEDIMIARDILLSELTGGRVHILHVSTAASVELIRQGIKKGIHVSGEACPHHFLLTDESLRTRDSNFKMAPPLRTQKDVDAILEGLHDGTLSVLATDHAPHSPAKKSREFSSTPNGIIGLETFLPLCITHLIETGRLTWPQMLAKMTCNPAKVLGIDRGTLQPGRPADVTVIDPKTKWTIDVSQSKSKSRNSPFNGWPVVGRAMAAIVAGEVKMSNLPA